MEVAFRFLLRPLFMSLLASNPRAGDPRKRKRTATQMLPRAVCFVHNVLQVPLALRILRDPRFAGDALFFSTPFSRAVMLVSAGYFLYDTLECIWRFEHEGPEFLLHGVMCFVTYAQLYTSRQMNWLGAGFLLWELSTPFMHARWFLYKIGRDKSAIYPLNALTGMLVFFLCRNCFGPWLSWQFLRQSSAALVTARGERELWMPSIWFFRVAVVVLNGLNAYWFSKMVKMLAEALGGGGGGGGGGGKKADDGGEKQARGGGAKKQVELSAAAHSSVGPKRRSSRMLAGQA
jgi:hypothetical protein